MANGKRNRIVWTEDEYERLATKAVAHILKNPSFSTEELFTKIQETLPLDRRRQHTKAFTQAPILLEKVRHLMARLTLSDDTLHHQITALEATQAQLTTEIAELKARPEPPPPPTVEQCLQDVPTEKLIAVLLSRASSHLTNLLPTPDPVGLHRLDHRIYQMQIQIAGLMGKNGALPTAPAPIDPKIYMPMFIVAGGTRQDFQRLQNSLIKANVRLKHLDLTKPAHLSLEKHDQVVLWADGTTPPQQAAVTSKAAKGKLLVVNGTLAELGPAITNEARAIREQRENPVATNGAVL